LQYERTLQALLIVLVEKEAFKHPGPRTVRKSMDKIGKEGSREKKKIEKEGEKKKEETLGAGIVPMTQVAGITLAEVARDEDPKVFLNETRGGSPIAVLNLGLQLEHKEASKY
jgi:hypothetical protein